MSAIVTQSTGFLPYTRNTYIELYTAKDCGKDSNGNTLPVNQQQEIVLRFPSNNFPRIPLISREISIDRQGEVGYGILKCNMTLQSFITGDRHSDIVSKYMDLERLIGMNDLYMSYVTNIGNGVANEHRVVYDKRVYIDNISQPQGWKQHMGEFVVSLHYFINRCDLVNSFGIEASFMQFDLENYNETTSTSYLTYKFDPTPLISFSVKKKGSSYRSSTKTPYGEQIKRSREITLNGILKEDSHSKLKDKMDKLEKAFSENGILNYGDWTKKVYVESGPDFTETLPHSHVNYSIKLICDEEDIHTLTVRRTFSRVHRFLKIDDRLYCGKTEEEEFHESGQYVDYEITLGSDSRQKTRRLLSRELLSLIYSGGKEVPGGSESWEDDRTIKVNIKKFHKKAILPNIESNYEDANGNTKEGYEIPPGINPY
jgi:hypothetical protein